MTLILLFYWLFLRKFADDTKMAMSIRSKEDAEHFQREIDNLCKWAEEWAMTFNQDKCKVMHVGRSNPRYVYYMNGLELSETEKERDLGVWTESSLKPLLQCTKAANNANCLLGMHTEQNSYLSHCTHRSSDLS